MKGTDSFSSHSALQSKCFASKSTHRADPLWHRVSARGAVVGVDDNDGDDDGGNDKHHGEEHVLPDERHGARGRRDQLHDDQQEHSQRQQDGDAEGHLLTWETQWTIFTAPAVTISSQSPFSSTQSSSADRFFSCIMTKSVKTATEMTSGEFVFYRCCFQGHK